MFITLEEIRDNSNLIENIRMDLIPADIFKPRYSGKGDLEKLKAEVEGYFFYVEIIEKGPELMLMRNAGLKSKTLAEVTGIPSEYLRRIIIAPDAEEVSGMYPIDEDLRGWLKAELGL